MVSQANTEVRWLTTIERRLIALVAIVSISIGVAFFSISARDVTEERDGNGALIKTVDAPRSSPELAALFSTAGIVLLFWSLNGLRLTRFGLGTLSVDMAPSEQKAAEEYAKSSQAPQAVTLPKEAPVESEPAAAPTGAVVVGNEAEAVYPLDAVPRFVFEDLFASWPGQYPKPPNFSAFEFALRRKGSGNHPWIVKFRDLPALRLSYGGQGKTSATVSERGG